MDYEYIDCIDAGTKYCPCSLAETGECILCSCLKGEMFCDCKNWKGVCIFSEFINNGRKSKETRETIEGEILSKRSTECGVTYFKIKAPHHIVSQLSFVGSFVFLRNKSFEYFYDAPISIMESNTEEDTLEVAIEIRGTKTKGIMGAEDKILIRGPYWNGVFGVKRINNLKHKKALIIGSGIGMAPSIPVVKKLIENNNEVTYLYDTGNKDLSPIIEKLKKYNIELININIGKEGKLTEEFLKTLLDIKGKVDLIHVSAQDIFILQISDLIEDKVYTCSNNAKMCCGEGGCGACSARFKNHRVKKLCKLQIEPKYLFKERRLI